MNKISIDEISKNKKLFDFKVDWKKPEPYKDEVKEKLEKLKFDSGYFVNWCYDSDEEMTLSKTRVWFETQRRLVGKGKNQKVKFFLITKQWWELFNDVLEMETDFKDIKSLEETLEYLKENIELAKEMIKKGIIFDGRRYWWKFEYVDKKLNLIEKITPGFENE